MKIVITGGAGYIGSMLCSYILKQLPLTTIDVFDNLCFNQWDNVKGVFANNRIKFYNESVLDWSKNLQNSVENADYIICLAAVVGAPACDKDVDNATALNYDWYNSLLKYVSGKQKIIFPNTNSGYGTSLEICTEETPTNPISLYGKLKEQTEKLLLSEYKNGTICFRLATVFGLSPRPRLDLLVNNFVYKAVKDGHLDIFDGHFRRNFISVNDVCRAFLFVINKNNFDIMRGETYNMGTDSLNSTKLEFAKKIQEIVGCKITEHTNRTDPDKRDYIVSNQKLYSYGFSPIDTTLDNRVRELQKFCQHITNTDGMFNY